MAASILKNLISTFQFYKCPTNMRAIPRILRYLAMKERDMPIDKTQVLHARYYLTTCCGPSWVLNLDPWAYLDSDLRPKEGPQVGP